MKIIDTHSHLWLRQDTSWNGLPIRSLKNGRSVFLGEEVQMIPPFIIDGENSAEVFLSNMDYAQVSAAVVVQELIDGCQNDYLLQVAERYPDRFITCGMGDYFADDLAGQVQSLISKGFKGIAVPGHRLILDDSRVMLDSPQMVEMFKVMEREGVFLSITLADGDAQVGEMKTVIQECPDLKIAIGHFGMPTREGWMEQIKLAENKNVYVESGGITWLYNSEFYPFKGAVRAIREAADAVGMDKLMWGSDYPRTITAITYRMSYDFILKSTELTDEQKALFLGENACRFYGFKDLVDLPYIKNMSE
ncbi:MAG: amidohydrolase [Bacteroidales bacterium]|nr:amidohydrolase [Bacteroidales bacterium]